MIKKKKPNFVLHGMTKGGAVNLFNFYRRAFGVELVSEPEQLSEGRWRVVMTHPFPTRLDEGV